jgi:ATP-dependent helicase/nuclease subunit A
MVNLLQWLITPFNNHALAGILRSPLFSTPESDLYPLVGKSNWFEAILDRHDEYEKTSPLARASYHLQNWLQLTDILPVHDLLDRIYSEGNVLARYQANYPEHLRARVHANLTRFIELALENDSGRYPSLTRFLGWLSLLRQQDREAPDQPASSSDINRVRILTIHESKGLESPVVFLLDAATTKPNRGGNSVLIDWPCEFGEDDQAAQFNQPRDFLVSPSAAYPNSYCEALLQRQEEKERQEEANLLYVAVTRAQQYLYISGSGKPAGWYEDVCQQYEINPEEISGNQQLETHQGKILADEEKTTSRTGSISPDPRLEQPVNIKNRFLEISPSNLLHDSLDTDDIIPADKSKTDNRLDSRKRGILIHKMIEDLTKKDTLSFSEFCRRNLLDENDDRLSMYWQQAEQCIETFPEYFKAEQYNQAYSEVPVTYKKDDVIVNGIIDRLVVRDNDAIILDYKTHQVLEVKQLNNYAEQFRSQLSLYKDGVALLYPDKQIKTYVIFTAVPACIKV